MEFPFPELVEQNISELAAGQGESLYRQAPVVAAPYIGVLGVAAVVGTVGNLVVIAAVTVKYFGSLKQRAENSGNDVGRAFIANLALSDLIVTALINPLAIAGMYELLCGPPLGGRITRAPKKSPTIVGEFVTVGFKIH